MTNLTIIISSGSMWSSSQRGIFAATSPSFISFAGKGKTFSSQESGINNILVPTTTAVTADTSSKESPANRICALHLFPFGHLYSVLNRCDPFTLFHFSPLQRKENTPLSSKIHLGLALLKCIRPRRRWTSPSCRTLWVAAAFVEFCGMFFCFIMAVQPVTAQRTALSEHSLKFSVKWSLQNNQNKDQG